MVYKPNYYLIPGVVADDEEITYAGGKLYAIIYWLSEMSMQKCIASNDVLAEFMGKKTTADYVIRLLKKLEERGYIRRVYSDETKQVREEIIPLVTFRGGGETNGNPRPNDTGGGGETIQHINKIYKQEDKEYILLSEKLGKTPLSRLKTFYCQLYRDEFDVEPKVFLNGKDGGVLKSLLKDYSELQICALMIAHFNWYGPYGSSEAEYSRMRAAAFPITWIGPNVNKYVIMLKGTHSVAFDEPRAVYKFTKEYIRGLTTDGLVF